MSIEESATNHRPDESTATVSQAAGRDHDERVQCVHSLLSGHAKSTVSFENNSRFTTLDKSLREMRDR